MSARIEPMGERPAHVKPPAYLAKDKPVPKPEAVAPPAGNDPTRYGDWERKGIAVDF